MKLVALVVFVIGCGKGASDSLALAPVDSQQIRDLVRAAQSKAAAYATARETGLRLAWRNAALAAAPCPEALPQLPLYKSYEEQSSTEREALDIARWRMTVISRDDVLGGPPPADEKPMQRVEREVALKGPRADQFERQSKMLLRIADDGKVPETFKSAADVIALARELGSDPYWDWELVVVASEQRTPLFTPEGFAAGAIEGKAFLWSFKAGRVVCVADVNATSQSEMKLSIDPNNKELRQHQVLNDDLRNQAYRAAIGGLKAVL